MRRFVAYLVAVLLPSLAIAVDADGYFVYRPDAKGGSGGWADGSRWYDGVAPSAGSKVKVGEAADAPVTDADMELFTSLAVVWINATNAVVRFRISGEYHVPESVYGSGAIVLEAPAGGTGGTLWFDCMDDRLSYKTTGGITVRAGALHLQRAETFSASDAQYGVLAVWKPGVLYLPEGLPTYTAGLVGDGSVSNLVASGTEEKYRYFKVAGGSAAAPYEFSGNLGPNISYMNYGGHQYFRGVSDSSSRNVRLYSGTFGVAAMTRSSGDSITTTDDYNLRGSGSTPLCIRYLGEAGGESTHTFKMFNDAKDVTLDGGPNGGLTVKGAISASSAAKQMTRFSFGGDHQTACVLKVPISEATDLATYVTKTGTGTWRFAADNNTMRGVLDVRRGTLEYTSVAERGEVCALGYQNILHECYVGARDDSKTVSYAIRLGDGSSSVLPETATLSYVGSSAATCASRPIALSGAGRVRNAGTSAFCWSGVTTLDASGGTLVLDGPGEANAIRNVTNGLGAVSIAKEGTGTWTVGGDLKVGGSVASRGGILRVNNRTKYDWYRFNVRGTWRDICAAAGQTELDNAVQLRGFMLIGEDNATSNVMLGATYNAGANGDPTLLAPGEVCFGNAANTVVNDRDPSKLFSGSFSVFQSFASSGKPKIDPGDSNTWVQVIMRLPVGTGRILKYDIAAGTNGSDGIPYFREARSWSIDGSVDGVVWECLAEEDRTLETKTPLSNKQWYSTRSSSTISGFDVDRSETTVFHPVVTPAAVGAANGGRVEFAETVTTQGLVVDGAATAGTIANVSFAAGGLLSVSNFDRTGDGRLPVVFENATGLENLESYSLELNGKPSKRGIVVRDGQVYIVPNGMILLLK